MRLFNSFPYTEKWDENINAIVLANGTVIWVPPATYTTLCDEEEDDDHHHVYKCRLQLAPWTRDANDMPMELFEGGFDTKLYLKNCPYVVTHSSVRIASRKYDCCPTPFLHLLVDLTLERHHDDDDDEEHEEPDAKQKRWEKYRSTRPCFWPHC